MFATRHVRTKNTRIKFCFFVILLFEISSVLLRRVCHISVLSNNVITVCTIYTYYLFVRVHPIYTFLVVRFPPPISMHCFHYINQQLHFSPIQSFTCVLH